MSVSHSACVLQVVHSRFQDLVPVHLKDEHNAELMRPDDEEISEVICVLLLSALSSQCSSSFASRGIFLTAGYSYLIDLYHHMDIN